MIDHTTVDMNENHYTENLRHMAEPASPSEREKAVSVTLEDYQALYLSKMLQEWGAYHTSDENEQSIAEGYREYIDRQVRERGNSSIDIFAHTPEAADVIVDCVDDYYVTYQDTVPHDLFTTLDDILIELWAHHNAEQVNKDIGHEEYEPAPEEITVQRTIENGRELEAVEQTVEV